MIFTGTGKQWVSELDPKMAESLRQAVADPKPFLDKIYDQWFADGTSYMEALVNCVNIPTIGVINGPGAVHTEIALLCDITLCAEDAMIGDPHFSMSIAPGDGQLLVLQELIGQKRANLLMYDGQYVDAKTALDIGLVNEVLPREKLLPRAWELAERIMKKDRIVRRITAEIVKRRWRRLFVQDFKPHFAMECFATAVTGPNIFRDLK